MRTRDSGRRASARAASTLCENSSSRARTAMRARHRPTSRAWWSHRRQRSRFVASPGAVCARCAGASHATAQGHRMSFAEDVRAGLTASPKRLLPKYFYDDLGSSLFDSICLLPEYYLTRAEDEILDRHARDIVAAVGTPLDLVELGSGSAVKTRRIITAALERQPALRYRPIDISPSALKASTEALSREYPTIRVDGIAADYLEGLKHISRNGSVRTMALFLGSNIGNFEPAEAIGTLRAVRAVL